jgi:hypothetical protein
MNRYDAGSARNSEVIDKRGSEYTVYSQYTYNGGRSGWVKIQFAGKKPECIEFHDFSGQCRAIGHSPGQAIAMGAVVMAVGAATSSGSNSGSGDDCESRECQEFVQSQHMQEQNQQGP